MNVSMLVDFAGWVGAVLILAGYGLLTAGKLTSRDAAYQWMNVVGAVGFIVNSAWHAAWPSAILNVIWVGIGVVALVRMGMGKSTKTRSS
jgi:hypothetical protein